jgi:magnesium transporter
MCLTNENVKGNSHSTSHSKNESENPQITLMSYDEKTFHEKHLEMITDDVFQAKENGIKWINVDGIQNTKLIGDISKIFSLHSLTTRDIINLNHRPKVEDMGKYIYLTLKMIYLKKEKVTCEQISIVMGENFVLSFQERKGDVFDDVRKRIRTSEEKIRAKGTAYLVYSLLDAVINNYFLILEKIGDKVENLQEKIIKKPSKNVLQMIHDIKRKISFIRRETWPLREMMSELMRYDTPIVSKEMEPYLRELYEQVVQVIDISEGLRDSLSDMIDIYLSSLGNKTNEIMKVLTIFSTIFIPLTFITGVYGMNFKNMPELNWTWGYPVVWMIMGVITILMFIYFKRKKWM